MNVTNRLEINRDVTRPRSGCLLPLFLVEAKTYKQPADPLASRLLADKRSRMEVHGRFSFSNRCLLARRQERLQALAQWRFPERHFGLLGWRCKRRRSR